MKTRHLLSLILALFILQAAQAQKPYEPNWESLDSRPVAPWFEDAKFGIFIHWGPYSVPAWSPRGTYSEWYQYWMQTKTLFGNGDFTGTEVYDHHVKTYGEDFSYYDFGPMFTAEEFDAGQWAKEDLLIRDLQVTPGTTISLLGTDIEMESEKNGNDLLIKLPQLKQEELPGDYAYVFKISE